MNEKILERVQRLLALSQSKNPNEAALAAAKAQRLILEYQLNEYELRSSADKAQNESVTHRQYPWGEEEFCSLATIVAKAVGCFGYKHREYGGHKKWSAVIIGRESALETYEILFVYVLDQLLTQALEFSGIRARKQFLLGAWQAIHDRLKEEKANFQAQSENANQLVRHQDSENRRYVSEILQVRLVNMPGKQIRNNAAFEAGKAAGANVRLSSNSAITGQKALAG